MPLRLDLTMRVDVLARWPRLNSRRRYFMATSLDCVAAICGGQRGIGSRRHLAGQAGQKLGQQLPADITMDNMLM